MSNKLNNKAMSDPKIDPYARNYRPLDSDLKNPADKGERIDLISKISDARENVKELNAVARQGKESLSSEHRFSGIQLESIADRDVARENYDDIINSLEIEISALDALSMAISENPDTLQISLFDAKIAELDVQIESLNNIYLNDGFTDLNKKFEIIKIRFNDFKLLNTQKLKAQL